jgi:hypothetical protein
MANECPSRRAAATRSKKSIISPSPIHESVQQPRGARLQRLEAAGVDRKQAEAHAEALRHAAESDLPSKADFISLGVLWKLLR